MRTKYSVFLILSAILLFAAGDVFSEELPQKEQFWKKLNYQSGEDIWELNIDSQNRIYAGIWGKGLYRSDDTDTSWFDISGNLGNLYITFIKFDDSGVIYIGTDGGGIYKSVDDGANWSEINEGLTNLRVSCMTIDHVGTFWVGTRGSGVFKSIDGGNTWARTDKGIYNHDIISIITTRDSSILAGTAGDYLYRTKNSGESWTRTTTGLESNTITDFIINSTGFIYAATLGGGVQISVNEGVSWSNYKLQDMPMNCSSMLLFSHDEPIVTTYDDGIWKMDWVYDYWRQSNIRFGCTSLAMDSSKILYAASPFNGIFKSVDFGETWQQMKFKVKSPKNTIGAYKNGLAFLSKSTGGVRRTTDNGNSWADIGLDELLINDFGFDSLGRCYAMTVSGIQRTSNSGSVWTASGLADVNTASFAAAPDGVLYAAILPEFPQEGPPPIEPVVYMSNNGGSSWTAVGPNESGVASVVVGANIDSHVFYAFNGGNEAGNPITGIKKSINMGTTWTTVHSGSMYYDLTFNSKGHIFAACDDGLLISTDDGNTWRTEDFGLDNPRINRVVVLDNDNIYTSAYSTNEIYRSDDDAATWTDASMGIVQALVESFSFSKDGFLFAALGNTLYRSIENEYLTPPLLTSPDMDEGSQPLHPVFQWEAVEKAEMYELEISKNMDFVPNIERVVTGDLEYTLQRELEHFSEYYWRLRSRHLSSAGPWSSASRFATEISKPNLISPADSSGGIDVNSLTLVWDSVPGALTYDLQVALAEDFTNIIYDETDLADTVFDIGGLDYSTAYYWRVRAKNPISNSQWSEEWEFYTTLAAPELSYPADSTLGTELEINFSWHPSFSSTTYTLQVATDEEMDNVLFEEYNADTSIAADKLNYFTEYFWRVKAGNEFGESQWSEIWRFYTTVEAPELIAPENNSKDNSLQTVLEWEPYKIVSYYHLQVSTDDSFTDFIVNDSTLDASSYSLDGLLENYTTYYWRVKYVVEVDYGMIYGQWSEIRSFTTTIAAPLLSLPENNSENTETSVNLVWLAVEGAQNYQVQLSTDDTFSNLIIDREDIDFTQTDAQSLDKSTKYYWRVKAFYEDGESQWSETWNFTTGEGISVFDLKLLDDIQFTLYPNPFTQKLNISITLAQAANTEIEIYDAQGIQRAVLFSGFKSSGHHSVLWNSQGLPGGMYIIVVKIDEQKTFSKGIKID